MMQKRFNLTLFLILITAAILRIFVALDPFLHNWDEKYHALVAKHLIQHPLKPTLYENALLDYSPENWVANHIWLEKGPVPLWSMALSLKVFGLNVFALRIPSVLISILAVWLTFLIGKVLLSEQAGFLAAGFHAINGLIIEVTGGRISSDHVETFFIFLVELAVYLVVLVMVKPKVSRLSMVIGLVTGLAFLTKWSPALLVFPLWLIGEALYKKKTMKALTVNALIGVVTFLLVTIPWILYITGYFPEESSHVIRKFLFAYTETVEQHKGSFISSFTDLGMVFGELIWVPLIWSLYYLFRNRSQKSLIFLNAWWMIPFVIFFFAATKRHTYMLISAPAFFLIGSQFIIYMMKEFKGRRWVAYAIIASIVILQVRYSVERIKPFKGIQKQPSWVSELKNLNGYDQNTVFMNHKHAIEGMFYTDYIFYDRLPYEGEVTELNTKGYKVVIMP